MLFSSKGWPLAAWEYFQNDVISKKFERITFIVLQTLRWNFTKFILLFFLLVSRNKIENVQEIISVLKKFEFLSKLCGFLSRTYYMSAEGQKAVWINAGTCLYGKCARTDIIRVDSNLLMREHECVRKKLRCSRFFFRLRGFAL